MFQGKYICSPIADNGLKLMGTKGLREVLSYKPIVLGILRILELMSGNTCQ